MVPATDNLARYFAYGSNMPRARLEARVGTVRVLGAAMLPGHRLCFHKRGADGSGKCDVLASPQDADVVHGALFALDPSQLERLHGFEGRGYECVRLTVGLGARSLPALTYRALPQHTDASLLPFDWYLALVQAGAEEHALPAGYCDGLRRLRANPDPDQARAAAHRALLSQPDLSQAQRPQIE